MENKGGRERNGRKGVIEGGSERRSLFRYISRNLEQVLIKSKVIPNNGPDV